jgi:hypothetical protein
MIKSEREYTTRLTGSRSEIPNQRTTITVGASDSTFEQQQSSGSQTIQIVDVYQVPDDSVRISK